MTLLCSPKNAADRVKTTRSSKSSAVISTKAAPISDIHAFALRFAEMSSRVTTTIPVASRIGGFVYAIRNIVTEARKVEAAGRRVRYLNIGDPITFGFKTPPHLIEAVERALE